MGIVKTVVISSLVVTSQVVGAGTMGPTTPTLPRFYLGIEGGDSISTNTHFQPRLSFTPQTSFILNSPVNSDFTRDIGSEGFGGVFAGYNWNANMAFQFSYDYRNGYDWNISTTEPDILSPDVFDRYKASAIKIQTFLFDMVLRPTVEWGGIIPYIKGGIGFASNKINWLQNVDMPTELSGPRSFNTIIAGKTTTNFAWDAGVGANYFVNQQFTVGLGYRFVDVGALKTRNVFFDTVDNSGDTITPFEAKHIFLNEVSISAGYYFDYA